MLPHLIKKTDQGLMLNKHSNDIFSEVGFNNFQLFYVEAVINDSSFDMVNRVRPIFEKISLEEFIIFSRKVMDAGDFEMTQQFFYFLILFREMKHLQGYINSEKFPMDMLEKFIIFTVGYCGRNDTSVEKIMDDILFFINNEKLYELIMKSKFIQSDKLLLFLMLSKFDVKLLDMYFSTIKDVSSVINYFLKLPEDVLRGIISRNYHLFRYILIMMAEGEAAQLISSEFFEKYRKDIVMFGKLNEMIRKYMETVDLEKDRGLPFNMRDMGRISMIVNMAREMPDPVKAIEYFSGEQMFIDDVEKKVAVSAVTDPLMKNVFSNKE